MDTTIRWGTTQSQPILMIPGPTELPFPVVQAMSQPATIQYDLSFDVKILEPVTLALRDIFQTTRSEVIAMPGSGRTALEAAAISVVEPGDRVLVIVTGVFGSLMREIMNRAGAEVTEHTVEWGHPLDLGRLEKDIERVKPKAVSMVHNETSTGTTYPAAEVGRIVKRHGALFMLDTVSSLAGLDVRTDKWGIDFNMTGLPEVPRRAARHGHRLGEPRGLGGDGAPQAQGVHLGLRPAALEGELDPDLARRPHPGRQPAPAAGLDPHPPHQRAGRGEPADPGGGPAAPLPPPRGGGPGVPGRHRVHAARDVPRRLAPVEHGRRASRLPPGSRPERWSATCASATASSSAPGSTTSAPPRSRVGHMGITSSPMYVLPTLSAIEMTLRDLGYRSEAGAGVSAAQAIFASPPA